MPKDQFEEYLIRHPNEREKLKLLAKQFKNSENLTDRTNYMGHVTASTLIFSPDHKKVLLIYHPTFDRWMQPGGHVDPGENPLTAAIREAEEETGVSFKRQIHAGDKGVPLLVETHLIPSRPSRNEPEHYHHAYWYAFVADSKDIKLEDKVIKQAKWAEFDCPMEPVLGEAIKRTLPLLS